MTKKEIPDIKWNRTMDALDGTEGTPSVTNKFVTNDDPRLPGEVTALEAAITVATDASLTILISRTLTGDTLATGCTIEIEAFGSVAAASGASLTMMWKFIHGDTIATGTVLLTMDAAISTSDLDTGWYIKGIFQIQDIGAAASGSIIGNAVLLGSFATPNTTNVSKVTSATAILTKGDQVIGLAFIWSGAAAANSLTCQNAFIKVSKRGKLSV